MTKSLPFFSLPTVIGRETFVHSKRIAFTLTPSGLKRKPPRPDGRLYTLAYGNNQRKKVFVFGSSAFLPCASESFFVRPSFADAFFWDLPPEKWLFKKEVPHEILVKLGNFEFALREKNVANLAAPAVTGTRAYAEPDAEKGALNGYFYTLAYPDKTSRLLFQPWNGIGPKRPDNMVFIEKGLEKGVFDKPIQEADWSPEAVSLEVQKAVEAYDRKWSENLRKRLFRKPRPMLTLNPRLQTATL
jgi:hypothetical protein